MSQLPITLSVACLCAQWCGSCRDYRQTFNAVASEFPHSRFRWVDIEDEAEIVDALDVENFPTLLIADGARALFFGVITPHKETLVRLLRAHASLAEASPVIDTAVHALAAALFPGKTQQALR